LIASPNTITIEHSRHQTCACHPTILVLPFPHIPAA